MEKFASVTLVCVILIGCSVSEPISGGNGFGVVLMHGKGGDTRWVDRLAFSLQRGGVRVTTPKMPWSRDRIYDRTVEGSLIEIDAAVSGLRARGARRIIIAGHSLGASAALAYAARRSEIAGVVVIAAGHNPGSPGFQAQIGDSVDRARAMVQAGRGNHAGTFTDINQGQTTQRVLPASIYLSWFAPDGPAAYASNLRALRPGTAILWIAGDRDRVPTASDKSLFEAAPTNPKSQFVMISSTHLNTPTDARSVVADWLADLR